MLIEACCKRAMEWILTTARPIHICLTKTRETMLFLLDRDNLSHNHSMGPLVWTHTHREPCDQARKPTDNEH